MRRDDIKLMSCMCVVHLNGKYLGFHYNVYIWWVLKKIFEMPFDDLAFCSWDGKKYFVT